MNFKAIKLAVLTLSISCLAACSKLCDAGYELSNNDCIPVNLKFAGDYSATDIRVPADTATYAVTITAEVEPSSITISNMGGLGASATVNGKVSLEEITTDSLWVGQVVIAGGVGTRDGNTITLSYTTADSTTGIVTTHLSTLTK